MAAMGGNWRSKCVTVLPRVVAVVLTACYLLPDAARAQEPTRMHTSRFILWDFSLRREAYRDKTGKWKTQQTFRSLHPKGAAWR
jgi:hypothetical protein